MNNTYLHTYMYTYTILYKPKGRTPHISYKGASFEVIPIPSPNPIESIESIQSIHTINHLIYQPIDRSAPYSPTLVQLRSSTVADLSIL